MPEQKPGILHIVETQQEPVLSIQALQDLGIVKVVQNVKALAANYKKKYAKVFYGLGCFSFQQDHLE